MPHFLRAWSSLFSFPYPYLKFFICVLLSFVAKPLLNWCHHVAVCVCVCVCVCGGRAGGVFQFRWALHFMFKIGNHKIYQVLTPRTLIGIACIKVPSPLPPFLHKHTHTHTHTHTNNPPAHLILLFPSPLWLAFSRIVKGNLKFGVWGRTLQQCKIQIQNR